MNETTNTKIKKTSLHNCKCRDFWAEFDVATDENGAQVSERRETTGCERQTNRLFAQGHDAKLVSFLVKWEIEGGEIYYGRMTSERIGTDATGAARTISEALEGKTERALVKAMDKAIARLDRQTRRKAKADTSVEVAKPEVLEGEIEMAEVTEFTADCVCPNEFLEKTGGVHLVGCVLDSDEDEDEAEVAEEPTPEIPQAPAQTFPRQVRAKVGRWEYDGEELEDGTFVFAPKAGGERRVSFPGWTEIA